MSVFGIFLENTKVQTNYVYSERAAGKGSNEVVSMLHHYAVANNIYSRGSSWTIYADNCGGQNKNNHLLRFLRFLVDSGRLRSASLYFLIKGHTKNNCDRGFATIKRAYSKQDIYTMTQVEDMIEASSTTNTAVNLEDRPEVFLDWKSALQPLYRDMKNIQQYQLFNMPSQRPGVILCRKRPTGVVVEQSAAKNPAPDFEQVWSSIVPAPRVIANPEKLTDLYNKLLPFIPDPHKEDPLYRPPTDGEVTEAREKKRRRTKTTLTWLQKQQLQRQTDEATEEKDAS